MRDDHQLRAQISAARKALESRVVNNLPWHVSAVPAKCGFAVRFRNDNQVRWSHLLGCSNFTDPGVAGGAGGGADPLLILGRRLGLWVVGFFHLRVVNPYEAAFREARSAVGALTLLGSGRIQDCR